MSRSSTTPQSERGRRGALARPLGVAVAVHLLLAVAQFVAAGASGSAGVMASAAHVSIGVLAHGVALAGLWVSTRPPDERHPYGYERFESLSAFVIGMLLLASVALIALVAVPRLREPEALSATGPASALMAASAVANAGLFWLLRVRGRQLRSQILQSESTHALADGASALAVLAGLLASEAGALRFDPLVALALAGLVAWRAWAVIRTAAGVLTDVAAVNLEPLRRAALSVPGVRDCHAIRSRGEAGRLRVDLHIHVDPDLTVREAHAIALAVERTLLDEVGGVVEVLVHVGGEGP